MENDKLVAKLKKHDEKALEQIMQRYTPIVATIIFNIANGSLTPSDIEEVVADVFITLWNNTDKVQADKPITLDPSEIEKITINDVVFTIE